MMNTTVPKKRPLRFLALLFIVPFWYMGVLNFTMSQQEDYLLDSSRTRHIRQRLQIAVTDLQTRQDLGLEGDDKDSRWPFLKVHVDVTIDNDCSFLVVSPLNSVTYRSSVKQKTYIVLCNERASDGHATRIQDLPPVSSLKKVEFRIEQEKHFKLVMELFSGGRLERVELEVDCNVWNQPQRLPEFTNKN